MPVLAPASKDRIRAALFFHQQLGRIGPLAVETLLGHKIKIGTKITTAPMMIQGETPTQSFLWILILPCFSSATRLQKAKVGIGLDT